MLVFVCNQTYTRVVLGTAVTALMVFHARESKEECKNFIKGADVGHEGLH
jgi:hypothetical protein